MEGAEILFRDSRDIQPPVSSIADAKAKGPQANVYADLDPALFVACQEDIWQPVAKNVLEGGETEIKVRPPPPRAVPRRQLTQLPGNISVCARPLTLHMHMFLPACCLPACLPAR